MTVSDRPSRGDPPSVVVKLHELEQIPVDKRIAAVARSMELNHRAVMKRIDNGNRFLVTLFFLLLIPTIGLLIQAGTLLQRVEQSTQDTRELRGRVERLWERR